MLGRLFTRVRESKLFYERDDPDHHLGHPSWVLMQNIQTGIRHYVGKSSQVILQADLVKQNAQDQELFKSPKALAFPPYGSLCFLLIPSETEALKRNHTRLACSSSKIIVR